jgi:hypothetical protein
MGLIQLYISPSPKREVFFVRDMRQIGLRNKLVNHFLTLVSRFYCT